jgi:Na+/H+ antiporter NhaA
VNQSQPRRGSALAGIAEPLRNYLETEAGSAGLLLAATVIALVWANSPWSDRYVSFWSTDLVIRVGDHQLSMDLRHWVNDGLMAFFFFVVGLEVRREFSVGELRHARNAVLPAVAATAGVLVPAALYLSINQGGDAAHGWGVVIGTDTAFLLASLALFGPSSSAQLRVLLLTITVFDDILAIGAIGLFYSDAISVPAIALAAGCVALFIVLDRMQVWRVTMYAIVGVILWLAVVESGLHPTIAGMVGGLLIAARPPRRDDVERAASLFRAFRQSPLPEVGYTA